MDINNNTSLLDSLLSTAKKSQTLTGDTAFSKKSNKQESTTPSQQDIVRLSGQKPASENINLPQKQTRLVSENTEEIENGFRRIQQFENKSGKTFTRIEELTTTDERTKRIVIQQNSSGSTTVAESILDRQEDGYFRLTQRFTDEIGETSTNIAFDVTPNNAGIILGHVPTPERSNDSPFQQVRGTQYDVIV